MKIAHLEAAQTIMQRATVALAGLDITPTQLVMLRIVERTPGCNLGLMARRLGVTPAVVTGLMDRLERRGWAKRGLGANLDRRLVMINLTDEGRSVIAAAEAALAPQEPVEKEAQVAA